MSAINPDKPVFVYDERYAFDLADHVFPTEKYRLVYENLKNTSGLSETSFVKSPFAKREDLVLLHDEGYVNKLENKTLSFDEIIRMELPFSEEVYKGFLLMVGGTITAANLALENGFAVHLGGGFHHAFPDHGEGFCMLNDVAVAAKKLIEEGKCERVMIVDLDVHHGNGTAYAFKDEPRVFTFSMHEEENYPFIKPPSDLDVGLPAGTSDKKYLKILCENLTRAWSSFLPDFVFYLAGADSYSDDQLGRLSLSMNGLVKRDKAVAEKTFCHGIPICVTLAGGYAVNVEDTAKIHFNTVQVFLEEFCKREA